MKPINPLKSLPVLCALLIICSSDSNAQNSPALNTYNYKTAIGVRLGQTSGLTIKQFVGGSSALEGIVGFWHNAISATLLYEKYAPAFNTSGFSWYYGAGGHAAFITHHHHDHRNHRDYWNHDTEELGLGIDGIVGLEYKVREIPFAFSLDLKPFVELDTGGDIYFSMDPGLGIKFTF